MSYEIKGEITIIIEGFSGEISSAETIDIEEKIREMLAAGTSARTVRDELAEAFQLSKKEVYDLVLRIQKET